MNYLGQQPQSITTLADVQRILKNKSPMMEGEDVRNLQRKLMALGYALPQYGADGVFGSETEMAVKEFQQDNNLSVTGAVGPSTEKALNEKSPQTAMTNKNAVSSMFTEAKAKYWDSLSSTEKWLYGGAGATFMLAAGIAITNKMNG